MLKISIENLDAVNELTMKIAALTFLQGQIVLDEYIDGADEYRFLYNYARVLLHDELSETVLRLRRLIESEGFTE